MLLTAATTIAPLPTRGALSARAPAPPPLRAVACGVVRACAPGYSEHADSTKPAPAPLQSLHLRDGATELATVHEAPAAELSHNSVLVPVSSSPNAAADPSPDATGLDDDADDRMRIAYETVEKPGGGGGGGKQ